MIRTTEVDGVPTLIAPTTGPPRAGLVFRVGRADETLARGGVTHLTEHLALHRLGLTDYHFNGTTGPVTTEFHLRGSDGDIVTFLRGVCTSLHDLPVDRLDTERTIVRTEWSSRGASAAGPLALWRHGARDHGLVSYPEFGLAMLRPEDLRGWASSYFTRENAVLWIAGPDVPAGLRLPLPAGERRPVPAPSSALPSMPAFFTGDGGFIAHDAVVRRGVAASMYSAVLRRALFAALRQDAGVSYNVDTSYGRRGDGYATVTAVVDALPEKKDAALGAFVDVLAALRVGRIDQSDLDAVISQALDAMGHPEWLAALLPGEAFDLLTGDNPGLPSADALRAVTVADIHRVAEEAAATALLMVPTTRGAEWAGFVPAPTTSSGAVTGTRYPARNSPRVGLVVSPDGVSLADDQDAVTVRYASCVALRIWPDGARHLVGDDGLTVAVEPTLFALDEDVVPALDAAVPPDRHIVESPRDPDQIPKPAPKPKWKLPRFRRGHPVSLIVVLSIVTAFFLVAMPIVVIDAANGTRRLDLLVAAGVIGATVYFVRATWREIRKYRRRP